jgi:hypothetical protein
MLISSQFDARCGVSFLHQSRRGARPNAPFPLGWAGRPGLPFVVPHLQQPHRGARQDEAATGRWPPTIGGASRRIGRQSGEIVENFGMGEILLTATRSWRVV